MKISSNMNAIMMVANMNKANNSAATAMERLSSGLKINSAGDNPAGLAIANKLNTRIKGIEQANNNAMDAISLVQTAEGALDEVHSMLNRIRELSVQSINASNGPEERESMQSEIEALIAEIQSISERTEFNGINILNNSEKIMVQIGSNAYENMEIDSKELNLGEVLSTFDEFTVLRLEDSGEIKKINDVLEGKSSNAEKVNNIANLINSLTATDLSKNDKAESLFEKIKNEVNSANDDEAKIRNIVSQIESAYENTKDEGNNIINKVDKAVSMVSKIRGKLGAYQNRLEHTTSNLNIHEENTIESLSRIEDADMAEEMTNYTQYNVIAQAGISMLAQANQRPQQVLQLLNS